jgi:hypothetical protein
MHAIAAMKKKAKLVSLVGEMFSKEEYVLAKTGGERIRLVVDELWEYVHPRAGDMVPLVSKVQMFGKGMSGQQQGYYGAQIVPSRAPPSITPVKLQTPGHARINSVVAPTKFVMVPSQIPSVEAQIPRNAHTISSVAPSPHTSGTPPSPKTATPVASPPDALFTKYANSALLGVCVS